MVEVHEAGTLEISTNGPTQGQLIGTPGSALARYEYDALGRRVRTVEEPEEPDHWTTRHVYGSGAAVLAEYDVDTNGSETAARWFVHGQSFPDSLVMVDLTDAGDVPAVGQPGGGAEYLFYLKDALGSPGLLTDADGQPVERYTYTPYGLTTIADTNGVERSALSI